MFVRKVQGDEQRVEIPGYEKDGVPCPEVLLAGPEVKEYADFLAMRLDFDHVITMCEHRAALAKDRTISAPDQVIGMRATWEAAVIAYGRAFVGGVSAAQGGGGRTRFPESILDRLNDDQRAVHEHTMSLRNKHVGHRVNDWTQVIVTAVLNPETKGARNVLQVGNKLFTVIGGGEDAEQLRDVAVILRDGLMDRMKVIEAEIMTQLRAQPIDELYESAQAEAKRGAQLMELERQRRASAAATQAEMAEPPE